MKYNDSEIYIYLPGVHQDCILSPCLFNLYAEYMPDWMKHKLKSRLPEEISITSDKQGDNIESEEELKSFLMKVKEESKKLA